MSMDIIRVAVCGAAGKMGREVVRTIASQGDLRIVGAADRHMIGEDAGKTANLEPLGVLIEDNLRAMFQSKKPDVYVDFTHPDSVLNNVLTALDYCHVVVGTTGITETDLQQIKDKSQATGMNAVVCPNFAIGAVLMMQFAKQASYYFPDVEIIELHHEKKADAPSGTSIKTAELIAENRKLTAAPSLSKELFVGARGANVEGISIHSVRLPGLIAHQEVIFGGPGQSLTIRHDSYDRTSFMPGVLMAIRKVRELPGLTYGLENLLQIS